jgi:hypothetical protein
MTFTNRIWLNLLTYLDLIHSRALSTPSISHRLTHIVDNEEIPFFKVHDKVIFTDPVSVLDGFDAFGIVVSGTLIGVLTL